MHIARSITLPCMAEKLVHFCAVVAAGVWVSKLAAEGIPVIYADNDAGHFVCNSPAKGIVGLQATKDEPAPVIIHKSRQLLAHWRLWLVDPDRQLGGRARDGPVLHVMHRLRVWDRHSVHSRQVSEAALIISMMVL